MQPETRKNLTKAFVIVAAVLAGQYAAPYILEAVNVRLKDELSADMSEEIKLHSSSVYALSAIAAFSSNSATIKDDVFTAALISADESPSTKIDFDFSTGRVCITAMQGDQKPNCDHHNFKIVFPDDGQLIKDIACTTAEIKNDKKFIQRHCVPTPSA